jgi:uncharacterized protein (DUF4415 family)
MKQSRRVKKDRKAIRRKPVSLNAAAEEPKRRSVSLPEVEAWYRPLKKVVTLRLDAEVLAWFKSQGRGYQTRINRALRKVMKEEKKDEKK